MLLLLGCPSIYRWRGMRSTCPSRRKGKKGTKDKAKRRKGSERAGSLDPIDRQPQVSTELSKLYQAVGFDPVTFEYSDDQTQKPLEWVRVNHVPDFVR